MSSNNAERTFYCEKSNYITCSFLGILRLDSSEVAVHSHLFSKISLENACARVLLQVKLQTDCSKQRLYTKMSPPRMFSWKSYAQTVQKQLSTTIYFRKFLQKILVLESFFWSNYRLTFQSTSYILKRLHQDCFLGNLLTAFGLPKYHRL